MEFSRSDLPPSTFVPVASYAPPGSYAPPVTYAPIGNYTAPAPAPAPAPAAEDHPSYAEMVRSAIIALNEKDGSSRQAIAKYIESQYRIPPSKYHDSQLSAQLRVMKTSGQLVLNKHSYMFPGSVTGGVGQGQVSVSVGPKKRPGRPPKLQPNGGLMRSGQPAPMVNVGLENQQVVGGGGGGFGVPTANLFGGLNPGGAQFVGGNGGNAVTAPLSNVVYVPVSSTPAVVSNGGAVYDAGAVANVVPLEQTDVVSVKRGRGRPRKVHTLAVGVGSGAVVVSPGENSAAQNNVGDGPPAVTPPTDLGKRRRGRPAKLDAMMTRPVVNGGAKQRQGGKAMVPGVGKRGRGRPKKNAVGAIVAANGRAAGGVLPVAKKARKSSGKPIGRPKKAASLIELQLMAYEGLKARFEHYQARIKQAVSVVKPYINNTAVIALGALQDLEELAAMDIISVPPGVQGAHVNVQGAPLNVQTAPVNVQNSNVLGAPVDLNAPVNVSGTAPENIQSAPVTAEAVQSTFQSAPSTGETTQVTPQSAPVPVQGQ